MFSRGEARSAFLVSSLEVPPGDRGTDGSVELDEDDVDPAEPDEVPNASPDFFGVVPAAPLRFRDKVVPAVGPATSQ